MSGRSGHKLPDPALVSGLLQGDADIPYGEYLYPCRLKTHPEGTYLSVQLHGTVQGRDLPVFARWNWGKILGAHVLSICDPTIYLDETLRIGWYLGNREQPVIPGVVAIAEHCAELIGIPRERIVYSGGSGGGFAALQAAAHSALGRAIVINPQTNLFLYHKDSLDAYLGKVAGFDSADEARTYFGPRMNAIAAVRLAISADHDNKNCRIVYAQNLNDWHYEKHFLPFAAAFDLDVEAETAVTGNFMTILYNGPAKHGAEPPELIKKINLEALDFLFAPEPAPEAEIGESFPRRLFRKLRENFSARCRCLK